MSQNTTTTSNTNVGFFGLMFLIFLVLKLTEVISWSWWWVTAPLWAPAILVILIIVAAAFVSVFLGDKSGSDR